jgi:hypothetical protein
MSWIVVRASALRMRESAHHKRRRTTSPWMGEDGGGGEEVGHRHHPPLNPLPLYRLETQVTLVRGHG